MTLKHRCPECGAPLKIADRHLGKPIHCPACDAEFVPPPRRPAMFSNREAESPETEEEIEFPVPEPVSVVASRAAGTPNTVMAPVGGLLQLIAFGCLLPILWWILATIMVRSQDFAVRSNPLVAKSPTVDTALTWFVISLLLVSAGQFVKLLGKSIDRILERLAAVEESVTQGAENRGGDGISFEEAWSFMCDRIRQQGRGYAQTHPALAERIERETEEFCALAQPSDLNGILDREWMCRSLMRSWSSSAFLVTSGGSAT